MLIPIGAARSVPGERPTEALQFEIAPESDPPPEIRFATGSLFEYEN